MTTSLGFEPSVQGPVTRATLRQPPEQRWRSARRGKSKQRCQLSSTWTTGLLCLPPRRGAAGFVTLSQCPSGRTRSATRDIVSRAALAGVLEHAGSSRSARRDAGSIAALRVSDRLSAEVPSIELPRARMHRGTPAAHCAVGVTFRISERLGGARAGEAGRGSITPGAGRLGRNWNAT